MSETLHTSIPNEMTILTSPPPSLNRTEPNTEAVVWSIVQAADERKADNIVILHVGDICYLADYFVIVTGFSRTQLRAIADTIEKQIEMVYEKLPMHTEGKADGSWILQDYGDILVHSFMPDEREFYKLEAFWGHAQGFTIESFAQEFNFPYAPPAAPSFQ